MTVNVSKPAINVREKLAELDKPTGIAGEAMLRAETPQEQQALVGISGRRNLLQNGAMTVSQRGTTFTSPDSGTYTLDRWKYELGGGAACTIEQSTDAPNGFGNSVKVTVTTPEGSIGAGDFSQLLYQIEGQDIAPLAYGTSDAKPMTFSFWAKSSVTGSFPLSFQNHNGTRVYPLTYTINNANTWEYKTVSIKGDTGGTWVTSGNTVGLRFTFLWVSGSNFTTGVDGGGWKATSGYLGLTAPYTAPIDTTNATLQITGVQLELGKVATPFEHRSYGEELALCQRYYQKHTVADTFQYIGNVAVAHTSTIVTQNWQLNPTMRAAPTLGNSGWRWKRMTNGLSNVTITGTTLQDATVNDVNVAWTVGTQTVGHVGMIESNGTSSAYLAFDAEL
tara:strand:- start:614 stop:1789 length:1176 start_codon:yes stop_codon:yes gene_type:complete